MRRGRFGVAGVVGIVGGALLATASDAHAHLVDSGLGPFYDGLAHPVVSVEDLLPVVAVALAAGLRGPSTGRRVLLALPLAWAVGLALGGTGAVGAAPPAALAATTVVAGALAAADRRWPIALFLAVATVVGAVHGVGNGGELSALAGGAAAMVGVVGTVSVLTSLVAGQAAAARAPWARIVARVAGSWIAAVGLLLLGWAVR